MSLYTLDGTTRKLLRLDRFGAPDFTVKAFIEQLSGTHHHLDDDRRLDPKPYIRTFESAQAELDRLHSVATSQEEAAEEEATELNRNRNPETQAIASKVEQCMNEVKALDEISTEILQTNGPSGQKLRRVSYQHSVVSGYCSLITAYLAFLNDKPPSELTRLWSTDRRKCAQFVGQLQKLATAIGPVNGSTDVQTKIDKYAEDMENKLVSTFQEKYQNFDLPGMRESADISTEFNGGGAIIRAYINQHPFFMNLTQLQQEEEDDESSEGMWSQLNFTEASYTELKQIIDKQFTEITDEITKETEIITKVFSNPAKVLSVFIQRTFAQRVQSLVSKYMEKATTQPTKLAQVRVLSVCYNRINTMVNALQTIWSKNKSGLTEDDQSELDRILDQNFSDVVLPYVENYFSLEKESLVEIVAAELHVPDPGRGSSTEDGRMDKLIRAVRTLRSDDNNPISPEISNTNSPEFGHERTPSGSSNIPSSVTHSAGSNYNYDSDLEDNQSSHNTSIAKLQIILTAFAEAISREQNLRSSDHFTDDATELFNLLMTQIGSKYISAVIDGAIEHSNRIDVKQPIKWTYLECIKTIGHALRLVSAFVKTVIFAMVQYCARKSQVAIANTLNIYISNVESSCRILVEQTADLCHNRTQYLLGRQNKKDFIEPSANADHILNGDLYMDFVALAAVAHNSLSNDNYQRLLRCVAMNFCEDIHNHITHFTVSKSGGRLLSNDISKYERLMVHDWDLDGDVSNEFATLRAISRLYTCDQSLLASLLRDSHLSKINPGQMRAYLAQRPDFTSKTMHLLYFNNDPRQIYRY